MRPSSAPVTGTTSGLGNAAASMLAAEGWRQVIVSGRRPARVQETAPQLSAETKAQVFTPLELDEPSRVPSVLAALARRLPSGMAAYAVSPGAATAIKARETLARWSHPRHEPASRGRRPSLPPASDVGVNVSGQYFASARRLPVQ